MLGNLLPFSLAAPSLNSQLPVYVCHIGGVQEGAQKGCNQEAAHSWEQDLCPVDAIIQEVV